MFQQTQTRPVDVAVQGATLTVNPLPDAGKPASFNGAVGQFALTVDAQPRTVHPGDPITLTLTLRGDGNFDRILAPSIPVDDEFRLFGDPVRTQMEEAVQFEQVISPRTAKATEIPAIPFSFFDTQAGQYRTVQSAPIPITVTASSNSTAQVFASNDSVILPPPETPFASESDLQRIHTALQKTWRIIRPWPIAIALGLAVFFARRIHRSRKRDTARVRRQTAPKAARKALRAAELARKQNNTSEFYDALWNALHDYFGNRLNLPPGDVTATVALQALSRKGFDPEELNKLRSLFEQVETIRYSAPTKTDAGQMEQLQQRLEKLLKRSEKTQI